MRLEPGPYDRKTVPQNALPACGRAPRRGPKPVSIGRRMRLSHEMSHHTIRRPTYNEMRQR